MKIIATRTHSGGSITFGVIDANASSIVHSAAVDHRVLHFVRAGQLREHVPGQQRRERVREDREGQHAGPVADGQVTTPHPEAARWPAS